MHETPSANELATTTCLPCEGGVPPLPRDEIDALLKAVPEWRLTHDATRIRRDWKLKNFRDGIRLLNNVGALAEREQHHPDLHLEGYRNVWLELTTHAIGGLSVNDFILAAKIDAIAPPPAS